MNGHINYGRSRNRHGHRADSLSTSLFSPFGLFGSPFGDVFGGNGMSAGFSSFSNFSMPDSNGPAMKVFQCIVIVNGKETIMSFENDVLKSKTVNGVPQCITYS